MHTYFAHSLILIINLKLIVLISNSLKQYKFLDATIKTININYLFTLFIKILLKKHYLFKRKNIKVKIDNSLQKKILPILIIHKNLIHIKFLL